MNIKETLSHLLCPGEAVKKDNADEQSASGRKTNFVTLMQLSKIKCYLTKLLLDSSTSHNLSPPTVFETVNSAISRPLTLALSNVLKCKEFLNYCANKISEIGQLIPPDSRETDIYSCPTSHLNHFHQISLQTLSDTVGVLKSSICTADCLPTWFLKAVIETGGLDILVIVNCSLSTGVFPSNIKHATIHPPLEKPSIDPNVLSNFQPISRGFCWHLWWGVVLVYFSPNDKIKLY